MSIYLPTYCEPIDRAQIASRHDPRDDARQLGRLVLEAPGVSIDWTLRPDRSDVRRWFAVDLAGTVHHHAAWPTILRSLAAHQPQALGRRRWR